MEALEVRTLFSLIGIANLNPLPDPVVGQAGAQGSLVYTTASPAGSLHVAVPLGFDLDPANPSGFAFGNLTIDLAVNSATGAVGAGGGTFTVKSQDNSTILLSGSLDPTAPQGGFGFGPDEFDFQFRIQGGTLSQFKNDDLGVDINTEPATAFSGDFTQNYNLIAKVDIVGIIPEVGSPPASISGHKYIDQTGDGISGDDLSHPLAGVTINLYADSTTSGTAGVLDASDTLVGTTTTAADGSYSFSGLTAGTYFVQEVLPAGYTETAPPGNVYTVTLAPGDNKGSFDFDNFQNISISGTKFNDLNGNGARDSGDSGIQGWTIALYTDTAGVLTATGKTTTTDANGNYSFTNLPPLAVGTTYAVREVQQSGWTQTTTNPPDITIASGENATGYNFGNFKLGCISGTKYVDVKGDDTMTTVGKADDTPYAGGVVVNLILNGKTVKTTTTDQNGNYLFTNLGAGIYTVQEIAPAGWVETNQSMGPITISSGTASTGNNIADFQLICISGTKFNDCSGNGFSSDDTGLGGIVIDLYKNGSSSPVATATTDSNGNYSFSNLGPGSYYVQEAPEPAGWTQTGGLGGYTINATSGGNYTCNNFDDYHTQCVVSCWSYEINGCTKVSDISGQLHQGDTVKVTFTITGPGTVSFVSYTAPDSYFVAAHAPQQKIFDAAVGTYSKAGTYSLTIVVPCCDYQVDFICGLPIDCLGTNSNIFYSAQNRLHDSDNGGTTTCIPTTGTCCGTGTITGCIFNDHNNDCKQQTGETGICGIQVTCYGTTSDGKCLLVDCTTDSNGNYKFCNLPSGCYKVIEHDPDTYYDGGQCAGNYGGTCTDDICSGVVISGNRTCSGYNFGELCGSDIQGTVFYDCNKDGKIESNDTGIAGVKLTLTGTDYLGNTVSLVTYTNAQGQYDFGNLAAGTYTLTETEPTGDVTTKDTVGTDGGTLSGDKISNIIVHWDTDGTGYNFGEI